MSGVIKNPFGMRNGRLIIIGDLTDSEWGIRCNCTCPECGGKFIARHGEIRSPHFAHEKNAVCDSVKAFMCAMYTLLEEAIRENRNFSYPGYYGIFYGYNVQRQADMNDIKASVDFSVEPESVQQDYEPIIQPGRLSICATEIQRDRNGVPKAILLKYLAQEHTEHSLAVVIVPPATICKVPTPTQYKNYATLAIFLEEDLYHIKSAALKIRIRDTNADKNWICSSKITNWMDRKLELQHMQHNEFCQQRERANEVHMNAQQETIAKKEANQRKQADENLRCRKAWDNIKRTVLQCSRDFSNNKLLSFSEKEQLYSCWLAITVTTLPDAEPVRDPDGRRWAYCTQCNSWYPDYVMAMYGGTGKKLNLGQCRECVKRKM